MKRRRRSTRTKGKNVSEVKAPLPTPRPPVSPRGNGRLPRWAMVASSVAALAMVIWIIMAWGHRAPSTSGVERSSGPSGHSKDSENGLPSTPGGSLGESNPHGQAGAHPGLSHGATQSAEANDSDAFGGSLLDQMNAPGREGAPSSSGSRAVPDNRELVQKLEDLKSIMPEVSEIQEKVSKALADGNKAGATEIQRRGAALLSQLNQQLGLLEQDLAEARRARPSDTTVRWLTGELLMMVGGEPKEILPYFEQAVEGGLRHPQLLASLAKVQFEDNRFEDAYRSAVAALDGDPQSRSVWDSFAQASFGLERYQQFLRRMDQEFPQEKPAWAESYRQRARAIEAQWQEEQRLRQAEEKAADLPQVRLTIEHRAFARESNGANQPAPIVTGRGDVIVELFEDQAPNTVANFLNLVDQGFYDGTLFHLVESAHFAIGGDPNTKNDDPQDDGAGGPDYSIPDECSLPSARGHFRGSLAMVNAGPLTAGSQFLIELSPIPAFNGRLTVFGRVVRRQQVVDQITPGRTNLHIGRSGKIIPGDVLVHAEVIRKRPHPYRVIKNR